jgi:hypothetical protein
MASQQKRKFALSATTGASAPQTSTKKSKSATNATIGPEPPTVDVAIDIGTFQVKAAYKRGSGEVKIVQYENGEKFLPAIALILENGEAQCGYEIDPNKLEHGILVRNPKEAFFTVPPHPTCENESEEEQDRKVENSKLAVLAILRKIRSRVVTLVSEAPEVRVRAWFTKPENMTLVGENIYRECAEEADLDLQSFVSEQAATFAYALKQYDDNSEPKNTKALIFVVFDFGGGSIDYECFQRLPGRQPQSISCADARALGGEFFFSKYRETISNLYLEETGEELKLSNDEFESLRMKFDLIQKSPYFGSKYDHAIQLRDQMLHINEESMKNIWDLSSIMEVVSKLLKSVQEVRYNAGVQAATLKTQPHGNHRHTRTKKQPNNDLAELEALSNANIVLVCGGGFSNSQPMRRSLQTIMQDEFKDIYNFAIDESVHAVVLGTFIILQDKSIPTAPFNVGLTGYHASGRETNKGPPSDDLNPDGWYD